MVRASRFVAAFALAAVLTAACSSGVDTPAASGPGTGGEWEQVVPGGDCECADGSEFSFWARAGDPTRVVLFLDGGGACIDATTCAFTSGDGYDWSIDDAPAQERGMFDLDRADNPFADHSVVYVPSCTGDMHLGDAAHEYAPGLTVQHRGYVNGSAALRYIAEQYPDATEVVVVGKTVGGFAAPVYGGLVADLLPGARVTVFAGQSGGFPDAPELVAGIFERWGAYATMPDWEVNEGLTARDWLPTRFWVQAGRHDPELVLARFDYAHDRNAARSLEAMSGERDLLARIDANEAAIEDSGVALHSYTAPGDDHGIFEYPAFYELEVEGVALVDWIAALAAGDPLDDVHCEDCE